MSTLVFPSSLPGFDIKIKKTPTYSTLIQPGSSGKEMRASFQSTPRWTFELTVNFLRQAGFSAQTPSDEVLQLTNLFHTVKGAWDTFYFVDPENGTPVLGDFGNGNGATGTFTLSDNEGFPVAILNGVSSIFLQDWQGGARTNQLTWSSDMSFPTTWGPNVGGTGVPALADGGLIGPDGVTANATRLVLNQGNGTTSSDLSRWYPNSVLYPVGGSTVSVWMKSNDGQNHNVALEFVSGTFALCAVTPTWQRFPISGTWSGTSHPFITLRGTYGTDTYADILVAQPQVEPGPNATAWIPTSGAAVTVFDKSPIRLYSTSRTNLLPQSELFTSTWNQINSTLASENADPRGTNACWKVVEDGTTNWPHWLRQSITLTGGQVYTLSVYAKPLERTQIYFRIGSGYAYVDLANLIVLNTYGGATATIQDVGNGWSFVTLTWAETATQLEYVGFGNASGGTANYTGDGASGVIFAFAQLVASNVPSGYIPTAAVAASMTDYTLAGTTVTFGQAPVNGANLLWTGQFFRVVRFMDDTLNLERFLALAWKGGTVKLITVK